MSIAGYSSGYPRVAIGTSIPSDSLTVIGNANGSGNGHIFVQNLNTSAASEGSLYIGVGTTVPANAVFSTVGSLWTGGGNGYTVVPAASTYLASIGNTSNGLTIGAFGNGTSSGILRFVAGGTTPSQERMRILANGNIGIGTTTPAGSLDIYGASNVNAISVTGATTGNTPIIAAIGQDTNISLRINTQGTGGIGINVAASTTNPLTVGSSSSNGNGAYLAAAGVWTNASDRRIKENIHPIQYGLDTVMKLDPVSYDMIGSHEHQVGFIAQQVLNVVPEVVGVPKNPEVEHYGLSYGNMVAVTVKAIQELKADNDNLRQQVNDLKGSAVRGQDSGIKNQELGVRSQNSDSIDRIIWIMCSGFTAILLMMGAIVLHTRRELHKLQKKLKKAS